LNRVCNGILAFEGGGKVHFSEGDYSYYIEKRSARETEALAQPLLSAQPEKQETRQKLQTSKLKWKEVKELETIEHDIMHAESEVVRIEAIFASPDFYEKRGDQLVQLTEELADAKAFIERLYARWHELEEIKSGNKE
jgi:ATP-binding cassette subfamily F protein uup